jgi:ribosome maturation factor RimP
VGFDAKLETAVPINNQRRWKGVIKAVNGDEIILAGEHGEATLKFSGLSDARLVLTDKLIEDDLRRAKAAEAADSSPASGGGGSETSGGGQSG